jgi:hypothetical protein
MLVDTTVWVDHLRRGDDVLAFIEVNKLMGRGLGWVEFICWFLPMPQARSC